MDGDAKPDGPSRDALVAAILAFLGGQDLLAPGDIRSALEREIDRAGSGALVTLNARLLADNGWQYYPRDPLAQRIHHLLADRFVDPDSQLMGMEHLAPIGTAPVTMCANHLSYADANVIEVLLQRSGAGALANRLTAIAGPKIFTSRKRRFSSLCFGTVKVPQSTEVASEEAVLSAREVARAARRAIDVARERLAAGDALLLFGEGTRSRDGGMQPMLPGVARYLEAPAAWMLPVGLSGSEDLFPIDQTSIRPARVTVQLGRPVRADLLLGHAGGDRRLVMDAIGLAIADVVPAPYRGVYADETHYRDAGHLLQHSRE
jgi:1-acyl-sn-glycerol-3-phosphate acyltransferase